MKDALQILGIIVGYAGSLDKNKQRILLYACLSNAVSILMFITIGRIDGIVATVIIGIRCVLFLFKDKYKTSLVLWLCVISHVVCGVLTFTDMYSLIPLLTTVATCFAYWYGDALSIKYVGVLVNLCWIIYYIYTELYLVAINTVVNLVLSVVAIVRIKFGGKEIC